ncbi:MAG: thiol reductant ABC exporter subunit CydC [Thermoleophilia bacterium]
MTVHSPLLRAAALGRPVRGRLVGGAVLSAVALGAAVALMATSGYLISRASQRPEILTLTVAIVGVRFFALLRAVARYAERLVTHDAALRVLVEARVAFLRRILRMPAGALPRDGDVLSRAVADVDRLQHLFIRALAPPVVAAAVIAGTAGAAWLMLPAGGAVVLSLLAATAVLVPMLSVAVTRRAQRRQAAARGLLATEVTEAVAAAPELVAWGRGDDQAARVAAADGALQRLVVRDALGAALAASVGTAAAGMTVVALLLVGVPAVADGSLAPVLLASLALMGLAAFEAVNALPAAAQGMAGTAAAAARLQDLGSSPAPAAGTLASPRGPISVALDGAVAAPAPGAPPAVRGATLRIGPGERVALVGPSGCGKSTLARMLAGLVPVAAGTATVDGRPLGDLDPVALRDRVRLCDQDAHLFATSIAENVRIGRPDAGDGEIREVLGRLGLGPWVDALPEGPGTDVGDDGSRVSGGQRQRIAVARGLIARPDLLVVDEPTSHLDDAAAARFVDDLLGAGDGTAVLMTTHRLAGLERFDRVLVMRDGVIAEDGPPAHLERAGGAYAAMLAAAREVDG